MDAVSALQVNGDDPHDLRETVVEARRDGGEGDAPEIILDQTLEGSLYLEPALFPYKWIYPGLVRVRAYRVLAPARKKQN